MNYLKLSFFPDAPSISEQLSQQGHKFKKKKAIRFQKIRLSIISLLDEKFITHEEGAVMAQKLADEINSHVMSRN